MCCTCRDSRAWPRWKKHMNNPAPSLPTWQDIPGSSARMMTLTFARNCMSSNAYIIHAEYALLVIDPGTHPEQLSAIRTVLQDHLSRSDRPVLILLTHGHHDHASGIAELPVDHPHIHVAADHSSVEPLGRHDSLVTLSYFFDTGSSPVLVDIALFAPQDTATPRTHTCAQGVTLTTGYYTDTPHPVLRQGLALSASEQAYLYQTPGHSEDSLSIQIGEYLFLGDLLFATQPGVAGAIGWDRDKLTRSCLLVERLVQAEGITLCLNGHGPAMPAEKAMHVLRSVHESAKRKEYVTLDPARRDFLKTCAHAMMQHITDLLTILSGRLYTLSFALEQLDDSEQSSRLLASLDVDAIEELLTDFSRRTEQYQQASIQLTLVLKSLTTINKLREIVRHNCLEPFITTALLSRIEHTIDLLTDTIHGLAIEALRDEIDLHALLREVIHDLQAPAHTPQQLEDSLDDPSMFSMLLALRVQQKPLLADMDIHTHFDDGHAWVRVNKTYAYEYMLDILEACATGGVRDLALRTENTPRGVRLELQGACEGRDLAFTPHTTAYLTVTARLFNWEIDFSDRGLALTFIGSGQEGNVV
ncbi:MAG: MBL fold metallo-hydrolase [Spartobacteria bacterium]|nr:MBL fold metallo-hydrolase [Spartobacteria bacterium]